MPRLGDWDVLDLLESNRHFGSYRGGAMCCSATFGTRHYDICDICSGDHGMTERRFKCVSKACAEVAPCTVVWKASQCSITEKRSVSVNCEKHMRGEVPCPLNARARISSEIKAFVLQQDESFVPPKRIQVNLQKYSGIENRLEDFRRCLRFIVCSRHYESERRPRTPSMAYVNTCGLCLR